MAGLIRKEETISSIITYEWDENIKEDYIKGFKEWSNSNIYSFIMHII